MADLGRWAKKMDSGFSTSIPLSIALYGLFLAATAGVWHQFKKSRLKQWARTEGKVVAYKERQVEDGAVYDPIITFSDSNGRETTIRPKEWWTRKQLKVGAAISVVFNPAKPKRAFIDTWSSCYPEVIALFALSGFMIFGACGMAMFFYAVK